MIFIFIASLYLFSFLFFSLLFLSHALYPVALACLFGGFFAFISLVVYRRGFFLRAKLCLSYSTLLCGLVACLFIGKAVHIHVGFFAVVCTSIVLFQSKEKNYSLGCMLATAACYYIIEWMPAEYVSLSPTILTIFHSIVAAIVMILIYGSVYYFQYANEVNEKRLEETIVELNRSMTQIQEAQMRLVESGKMAALGEMAGGIAHEINNPLAIIQMLSEQLKALSSQEGNLNPEKVQEIAQRIETTSRRIAKIITGLRTFCHDGHMENYSKTSLKEIIDNTLSLCSEKFKNYGINLTVKQDFSKLKINCNPVQISQVLLNLLNNSFDAIEHMKTKWIEIDFKIVSNIVHLSITDSGPGIPDDIATKLFQPFFTTKEAGKGTGIGLSLSKGLIEIHHGRIVMDRTYPNTRFVVQLPLSG